MLDSIANSKTFLWLTATAIASVVMMSYMSGYVYSRTEGDKLESRVNRLESRIDKRLESIDGNLIRLIKRK